MPSSVHAYNSIKNDATEYSPHFLKFGWHPRLPVDAFLGIEFGNKDHQSNAEIAREIEVFL